MGESSGKIFENKTRDDVNEDGNSHRDFAQEKDDDNDQSCGNSGLINCLKIVSKGHEQTENSHINT